MQINASPVNLTVQQAIQRAKSTLNQKSLVDMLRRTRDISSVDEDQVALLYLPYYVTATVNTISGGRVYHAIAATDGITGESGIAMGHPVFAPAEVDSWAVCPPRIEADAARERNLRCAGQAVLRRKRFLPKTEIHTQDLIYKPTYVVPLDFCYGKHERSLMRFVDGESGYIVYRYDPMWRSFPQLHAACGSRAESS